MTIKRNRLKHVASFDERLRRAANQAREAAEGLPPGEARDALLQRVKQTETAARINEWLASPATQSSNRGVMDRNSSLQSSVSGGPAAGSRGE